MTLIQMGVNCHGGECGCGGDMSRGELTSTQLKVPSQLSNQNPLYEIILFLNANFDENINAHY